MVMTYDSGLSRGPNRPGPIAQVARLNENIVLLNGGGKYTLFRVLAVEALPWSHAIVHNFGALAGGTAVAVGQTVSGVDLNNELQMHFGVPELGDKESELGQFRMRVLDDIRCLVYQRRQNARFVTRSARIDLSRFSSMRDPCDHMSEVFVLGDTEPFMDVTNPGQYALQVSRVAFYGFRYKLERRETVDDIKSIRESYVGLIGEGF